MNFRSLIFIALMMMVGNVSFGQSNNASRTAIMKALTDYDSAWNKKDVTRVSRVLADDYVYFSSTGTLTDRKRTLEFLASPDYSLTFVERTEIQILSTLEKNATVAVVSSRWKGKGTVGKEVINDDQRCGLVFSRQGKLWKLISEHCAQIVSK